MYYLKKFKICCKYCISMIIISLFKCNLEEFNFFKKILLEIFFCVYLVSLNKNLMSNNRRIYNNNDSSNIYEIFGNDPRYAKRIHTTIYQQPTLQDNSTYITSRSSRASDYSHRQTIYSERNLKGIQNICNTCFINSTLQVLLNMPQFISDLINSVNKIDRQFDSFSLIKEICLIYYEYVTSNKRYIQINKFFEVLREKIPYLGDGGQHDVAEFFQLLAESCENEILDYLCSRSKSKTGEILFSKTQMLLNDPFAMNFGFSIITNVICERCGKAITQEIQTNFILHLPLVSSSIEDCLAQSFEKEPIQITSKKENCSNQFRRYDYDYRYRRPAMRESNSDGYCCDRCRNSSSFCLSSSFYRIPRFLFIQVERFDASLTKNSKPISISNRLDITEYINDTYFASPSPIRVTSRDQINAESIYSLNSENDDLYSYGKSIKRGMKSQASGNCSSIYEDEALKNRARYPNARYKLISIILHEGSFSSGHYTAAIPSKESRGGTWSVISDDIVLENEVLNGSKPYCFIYQIDQ